MPHITLEALARLVDERPEADEARHLLGCAVCRTELEALRQQRAACADLPDVEPAPESWPTLRRELLDEGLIRRPRRPLAAPAWRAAASVALFVVGGLTGFALRGWALPQPEPAATAASVEPAELASVEEAERWLQRTENDYLAALSRYSQLTDTDEGDPATRLAALEDIVITTREALNEAPADPLLNGYHLTAVAQRDAMLRQISTSDNGWF